jgi:hypothetical protein
MVAETPGRAAQSGAVKLGHQVFDLNWLDRNMLCQVNVQTAASTSNYGWDAVIDRLRRVWNAPTLTVFSVTIFCPIQRSTSSAARKEIARERQEVTTLMTVANRPNVLRNSRKVRMANEASGRDLELLARSRTGHSVHGSQDRDCDY